MTYQPDPDDAEMLEGLEAIDRIITQGLIRAALMGGLGGLGIGLLIGFGLGVSFP